MHDPLRLGVLGAGQILQAHAEALADVAGLTVAAVCDTDDGRREQAARRFGARAFDSVADLLAAQATDAVLVALPHGLHCQATLAALAAGQHVVVEKPMAISVDEVNRMLAAARDAGRQLLVAESAAAHPGARRTGERFRVGDLGPFHTGHIINARFYFHEGRPAWFLDPALSGGGMFANVGLHRLATARTCLPGAVPARVSAGVVAHPAHPVEACTSAIVHYAAGGSMLYEETGTTPKPPWFGGGTAFHFAEGIVGWDAESWRWQRRDGTEEAVSLPPHPGYRPLWEDLLHAVETGERAVYDAAGFGADVAIAQATAASSREGREIDLRQPPWRVG